MTTYFWECKACHAEGQFRSHTAEPNELMSAARLAHARQTRERCGARSLAVASNSPAARHARCVERRIPERRFGFVTMAKGAA